MPIAIILIVGLVFYSSANKEDLGKQKNTVTKTETATTLEIKSIVKEELKAKPALETTKERVKAKPIQEPVKEEVKAKPIQETVKEEVKAKPIQEPVKEEVKQELTKELEKAEIKQPQSEPIEEEIAQDDSENNYLKIILYIIASVAAIFSGFYFFSNRSASQSINDKPEINKSNILNNS